MSVCARVLAAALMAGAIAVAVSFPAFVGGRKDARPAPLAPPAVQHQTIRLLALPGVSRRRPVSIAHRADVVKAASAELASAPLTEQAQPSAATHDTAAAPTKPSPHPGPATPPASPPSPPATQPPPAAAPPSADQTRQLAAATPPAVVVSPAAPDSEEDDQGDDEQGDGAHGHSQGAQHGDAGDRGHGGDGHGSEHDD